MAHASPTEDWPPTTAGSVAAPFVDLEVGRGWRPSDRRRAAAAREVEVRRWPRPVARSMRPNPYGRYGRGRHLSSVPRAAASPTDFAHRSTFSSRVVLRDRVAPDGEPGRRPVDRARPRGTPPVCASWFQWRRSPEIDAHSTCVPRTTPVVPVVRVNVAGCHITAAGRPRCPSDFGRRDRQLGAAARDRMRIARSPPGVVATALSEESRGWAAKRGSGSVAGRSSAAQTATRASGGAGRRHRGSDSGRRQLGQFAAAAACGYRAGTDSHRGAGRRWPSPDADRARQDGGSLDHRGRGRHGGRSCPDQEAQVEEEELHQGPRDCDARPPQPGPAQSRRPPPAGRSASGRIASRRTNCGSTTISRPGRTGWRTRSRRDARASSTDSRGTCPSSQGLTGPG